MADALIFECKSSKIPVTTKLPSLGCSPVPQYQITCEKQIHIMATNGKTGDGHRNGAVRDRSQFQHPDNGHWYKRDTNSGQIIDVNKGGQPHKGVRKEK